MGNGPIANASDKAERLKNLVQESRQVFLNEHENAFFRVLLDLLDYSLQPSRETAEKIERFFHNLHGSAATLEIPSLVKLGAEYEDYLHKLKESKDFSEQALLELLKGLALTHQTFEQVDRQSSAAKPLDEEGKAIQENISKEINKGTILLISPDKEFCEQLDKSLHEQGYALERGNIHEGKLMTKKEKIDLVLWDIRTSQNNFEKIIPQIDDEQSEPPILLIAPQFVRKDKTKALKAGVEDYISEPFTLDQIIIRIRLALQESHSPGISYVDNLTEVYTKEYLEKQVKGWTSQGQGHATLTIIDLSWIKEVNESHGYSLGDVALKELMNKLQSTLEENDEVYRLSGLEFSLLLPDQNVEQSMEKLQKIKNSIGTLEFQQGSKEIQLRPSFPCGMVLFTYEDDDLHLPVLLEQAHQALSLANNNSRKIGIYRSSRTKKKRILLVEDTDFMVHYVQSKLQVMNIEVQNAKDGEEGVRKALIERPDLMIVDLMLPKMDGFEVCRQIKANPKTKDIKIIIMSSRKSKEDVVKCFNLGVDDYIVKPFTLEDFERRIKKFL